MVSRVFSAGLRGIDGSVSYTHLDVYKRQPEGRLLQGGSTHALALGRAERHCGARRTRQRFLCAAGSGHDPRGRMYQGPDGRTVKRKTGAALAAPVLRFGLFGRLSGRKEEYGLLSGSKPVSYTHLSLDRLGHPDLSRLDRYRLEYRIGILRVLVGEQDGIPFAE